MNIDKLERFYHLMHFDHAIETDPKIKKRLEQYLKEIEKILKEEKCQNS